MFGLGMCELLMNGAKEGSNNLRAGPFNATAF